MCSSIDTGRSGAVRRWALATGTFLVALTAGGFGAGFAVPASAGVTPTTSVAANSTTPPAARASAPGRIVDGAEPRSVADPKPSDSGWVQLRCWQYGHLLFDEGPLRLASDTRLGARLVARRQDGGALVVTDTGSATCLARPAVPPPPPH